MKEFLNSTLGATIIGTIIGTTISSLMTPIISNWIPNLKSISILRNWLFYLIFILVVVSTLMFFKINDVNRKEQILANRTDTNLLLVDSNKINKSKNPAGDLLFEDKKKSKDDKKSSITITAKEKKNNENYNSAVSNDTNNKIIYKNQKDRILRIRIIKNNEPQPFLGYFVSCAKTPGNVLFETIKTSVEVPISEDENIAFINCKLNNERWLLDRFAGQLVLEDYDLEINGKIISKEKIEKTSNGESANYKVNLGQLY
jgi:hypothetical protein